MSQRRGDIPQGLIDAFLAMDTNMLDVSKDELNELAGKSDGGRGGGDLSPRCVRPSWRAPEPTATTSTTRTTSTAWAGRVLRRDPPAPRSCERQARRGERGDSRAVLSRRGEALALSRDHKPMDDDERARIVNAGGFVQEGRSTGRRTVQGHRRSRVQEPRISPPRTKLSPRIRRFASASSSPGTSSWSSRATSGTCYVPAVDHARARLDADVQLSKTARSSATSAWHRTPRVRHRCDNMSVVTCCSRIPRRPGADGKPTLRPRSAF